MPLELLAGANAMLSAARSLVAVGGLAAGGALVAVGGPGWAFAVDAVTYAASAALFARPSRLRPPDAPAEDTIAGGAPSATDSDSSRPEAPRRAQQPALRRGLLM